MGHALGRFEYVDTFQSTRQRGVYSMHVTASLEEVARRCDNQAAVSGDSTFAVYLVCTHRTLTCTWRPVPVPPTHPSLKKAEGPFCVCVWHLFVLPSGILIKGAAGTPFAFSEGKLLMQADIVTSVIMPLAAKTMSVSSLPRKKNGIHDVSYCSLTIQSHGRSRCIGS